VTDKLLTSGYHVTTDPLSDPLLASRSDFFAGGVSGEGGIRTRSLCYILENKDLEHKPFFYNELSDMIR